MEMCRVCRAAETKAFAVVEGRRYIRCADCEATMLEEAQLPDSEAERGHYLHHQNDPDDPGYRKFVARLVDPLVTRLAAGAEGLDYGCGPGPAGAAILRERGFSVAFYDPFFAPDTSVLGRRYDFIVCAEAAEHFHRPADEFDRLAMLLEPGGWLGILTCFQTQDDRFADWHYRRDPTHVVFYREATLRRLAALRGWSCDVPVKDVALMRAPGSVRRS